MNEDALWRFLSPAANQNKIGRPIVIYSSQIRSAHGAYAFERSMSQAARIVPMLGGRAASRSLYRLDLMVGRIPGNDLEARFLAAAGLSIAAEQLFLFEHRAKVFGLETRPVEFLDVNGQFAVPQFYGLGWNDVCPGVPPEMGVRNMSGACNVQSQWQNGPISDPQISYQLNNVDRPLVQFADEFFSEGLPFYRMMGKLWRTRWATDLEPLVWDSRFHGLGRTGTATVQVPSAEPLQEVLSDSAKTPKGARALRRALRNIRSAKLAPVPVEAIATQPPPPGVGGRPPLRPRYQYRTPFRTRTKSVRKAGANRKERKGEVASAVSKALAVLGALSEVSDAVDAVYDALPASLRKKLRKDNGKSLDMKQKLAALYDNYEKLDLGEAMANFIMKNVSDLATGVQSMPFDKSLQLIVPDYLTRLGVRQAIRWASWKSGVEMPEQPSVYKEYRRLTKDGEAFDTIKGQKVLDRLNLTVMQLGG